MNIRREDCSIDAIQKGSENQDNQHVNVVQVLEPAMYHDVPTNVTSSSPTAPNSAVSTATLPSSSTAEPSTSSSLQLISTYLMRAVKAMIQFFPGGSSLFSSSASGSEPPPTNTTTTNNNIKGQQQRESDNCGKPKVVDRLGITIVLVSDTHGEHEKLTMPDKADMLISAGDWTLYGKKEHVTSFNEWLGKLPYQTKIVVNGNHECNAMWKRSAKSLLSNAILLVDEFIEVEFGTCNNTNKDEQKEDDINFNSDKDEKAKKLKIYGTNFYWPCSQESNPYFDQIDSSTDILISHCPALGYVDNNRGCPALLNTIQNQAHPKIVISGHEHIARGIHFDPKSGITFVNAANAKGGIKQGHACGKQPIILTL